MVEDDDEEEEEKHKLVQEEEEEEDEGGVEEEEEETEMDEEGAPIETATTSTSTPTPPPPPQPPPQGTQRPHNATPPDQTLVQTSPRPKPTEAAAAAAAARTATPAAATGRAVRATTRGRGRPKALPLLRDVELPSDAPELALLPPAAKKKTRTLYTTDQLERLETLFQDDHYPDAVKRKTIATAVGVTPQRIMVWFQNRRAKWRKTERSAPGKAEYKQSRLGSGVGHRHPNPSLSGRVPIPKKGAGCLAGHPASIRAAWQPSAAPALPVPPGKALPTYGALIASLTSQSQPGPMDVGQDRPLPAATSVEYVPLPMHSPPPLRRASLPLFAIATATAYNP
ncbi:hypothetical protein CRUP_031011, partial [Coryphaenoides rupestris]